MSSVVPWKFLQRWKGSVSELSSVAATSPQVTTEPLECGLGDRGTGCLIRPDFHCKQQCHRSPRVPYVPAHFDISVPAKIEVMQLPSFSPARALALFFCQ